MATDNLYNPLVATDPNGTPRNLATDAPLPQSNNSTIDSQTSRLQGMRENYLIDQQEQAKAAQVQQAQQQEVSVPPPSTQQTPLATSIYNAQGALDFVPQAYAAGFDKWSQRTQNEYIDKLTEELAKKAGGNARDYRSAVIAQFKGQQGSKVGRQLESSYLGSATAAVMGGFTNFAKGLVGLGEMLTPGGYDADAKTGEKSTAREWVDNATQYWQQFYSENQKDKRLELQEDLQRGNYGEAALGVLGSPSLAATMTVESLLPSVIGAGKVRAGIQGVQKAAPFILGAERGTKVADAARKLEKANGLGANLVKVGIPAGVIGGGSTAYDLADDQGNMTAEQKLAAAASFGINMLVPSVVSKYAPTIESAFVNGFRNTTGRSLLGNVASGVTAEGLSEAFTSGTDAALTAAQGDRNNPNFSWQNVQNAQNDIIGQAVIGGTLGALAGGLVGGLSSEQTVAPASQPNVTGSVESSPNVTTPAGPPASTLNTDTGIIESPTIDSASMRGHVFDTIQTSLEDAQSQVMSDAFVSDEPTYDLNQVAADALAFPGDVDVLTNARETLADIQQDLLSNPDESYQNDAAVLGATIQRLDAAIDEMPRVRQDQNAVADIQQELYQQPTTDQIARSVEMITPKYQNKPVEFDTVVDKLAYMTAGNISDNVRNEIIEALVPDTGLTPEGVLEYGRYLRGNTGVYNSASVETINVPDSLGVYRNSLESQPDSARLIARPDDITRSNIIDSYNDRPRASDLPSNPLQNRDPRISGYLPDSVPFGTVNRVDLDGQERTAMPIVGDPLNAAAAQTTISEAELPNMSPTQQVADLVGPAPLSQNPTGNFVDPRGTVNSEVVRRGLRERGEIAARFIHSRNWSAQRTKKNAARVMAGEMELDAFLYSTMVAGVDAPARGVLYKDYLYAAWLQDQVDGVRAQAIAETQAVEMNGEDSQVAEPVTYAVPSSLSDEVDPGTLQTVPDEAPADIRSPYVQAILDLIPDVETNVALGQAALAETELYSSTRAMLEGYEYSARQANQLLMDAAVVIDDVITDRPDYQNDGAARSLLNYTITKTGQMLAHKAWQARMEQARNVLEEVNRDLSYVEEYSLQNGDGLYLVEEYRNRAEQARANAVEVQRQEPQDFTSVQAEVDIPHELRMIIQDKIDVQSLNETPVTLMREAARVANMNPAEQRIRSDIPTAKMPDFDAYYNTLLRGTDEEAQAATNKMAEDVRDLYRNANLPRLQAAAAIADIEMHAVQTAEVELDAADLTVFNESNLDLLRNAADIIDANMWPTLFTTQMDQRAPMAHYLTSDFWDTADARARMVEFDSMPEPDPLTLFKGLRDVYELTRTLPEGERDARQAKVAMHILRAADQQVANAVGEPNYLPAGPVPTTIPYLGTIDNTLAGFVRGNDLYKAMEHMTYQFGENEMVTAMMRLYRESPMPINIDISAVPIVRNGVTHTSYFDESTMTMSFANNAEAVPYNVVHETAHALTAYLMNEDASRLTADQILARDSLNALFNEAKQRNALVPYATNVNEFIAEAFSNPDQRTLLTQYQSNVTGLGRLRSAWQGFTAFVRRLLMLQPRSYNALADVMIATKVLLTPKPRASTQLGTSGATNAGARILRNSTGKDVISSYITRRGDKRPFAVVYPSKTSAGFTVRALDGSFADTTFPTYDKAVRQYADSVGYSISDTVLTGRLVEQRENTLLLHGNEGASPAFKKLDAMIRRTFNVQDGSRLDTILLRALNGLRTAKAFAMDRYAILQELDTLTGSDLYNIARTEEGQARADVGRYTGSTRTVMREIETALRGIGGNTKELGDFLYAQHVAERNRKWGGQARPGTTIEAKDVTGFTYTPPGGTELVGDAAAKAFLDNISGEKRRIYEGLSDRVHELRRDNLQLQLEAGLLNYGSYIALGGRDANGNIAPEAYKHYVPLLNRDRDTSIPGTGISGRYSPADNPLLSLLEQLQQTRFQIARNSTGNALLEQLIKQPMPQFASIDTVKILRDKDGNITADSGWLQDKDRTMFVMRNGVMHRIKFNNKTDMGKAAIEAFVSGAIPGKIVMGMTHITSTMAAFNTTASPAFMVKSFVWSLGSVLFNTQNAFNGQLTLKEAMKISASSLPEIAKYTAQSVWFTTTQREPTPLMKLYQYAGGGISGASFAGIDTLQRRLGDNWQNWASNVGSAQMSLVDITRAAGGRTIHAIHEVSNSPEDAIRFTVFKKFLEQKAGQSFPDTVQGANDMQAYMDSNPDIARAAVMGSKRLTGDFEAKGNSQMMRALFMFWNAGMQGARMFAGAASTRQGQIAFGLLMLAGYAVATQQMQDPDDEDYDGRSIYGRNRDRDNAIRIGEQGQIPIPYEARLAYAVGNITALTQAGKISNTQALQSLLSTARGVLLPLPYGGSGDFGYDVGLMAVPTFAMPAVTAAFGMSHFRDDVDGKGINILTPNGPKPSKYVADPMEHEKADYRTSKIAQAVANTMYDNLGLDMSPKRLDAVAGAMFGGAMTFGKDIARPDYEEPVGYGGGIVGALTKPFKAAQDQTGFDIKKDYKDLLGEIQAAGRRLEAGVAPNTVTVIGSPADAERAEAVDKKLQKDLAGITVGGHNMGYYMALRDAAAREGDTDTVRDAKAALDEITKLRNQKQGEAVLDLRNLIGDNGGR